MLKNAIILIAPFFFCVNSQTYPNQNCPVFRYDNQNGITIGRVELPNDRSGNYVISVNMSVAAYLSQNENIRIQRQTDASDIRRGSSLVYFINFPIQRPLPKPTRIEFNQAVYCTGLQESPEPGGGATHFWATDFLGTGGSQSQVPIIPIIPNTPPPVRPQENFPEPIYIPPTPPPVFSPRPITMQTPVIITSSMITRPATPLPTPSVIPSSEDCGISPGSLPLIVGGDGVGEKQFPWMAAIMVKINGSTTSATHTYKCTGSLVSNKHVITAGHCIKYQNILLYQVEDILVIFGMIDISNWFTDDERMVSKVSKVSVHPDYSSEKGDSDVAVFTLSTTFTRFTTFVRPICIWNESEDLDLLVNQIGTVAGWGSDKSGTAVIEFAAYVDLPIVSQVTCLRSNPKFRTITSSRTFCAGNRDGKGPCNGDSGAGFMMKRSNRWTLKGVVSRAINDRNTCDLDNYIIFADIAKMKDWLRQELI